MKNQEKIRAFILEKLMSGEDPENFSDEMDLIESGILDSLAMMQLVTFLEQDFGIKVETAEIVPENFASAKRLWAYVLAKQSP